MIDRRGEGLSTAPRPATRPARRVRVGNGIRAQGRRHLEGGYGTRSPPAAGRPAPCCHRSEHRRSSSRRPAQHCLWEIKGTPLGPQQGGLRPPRTLSGKRGAIGHATTGWGGCFCVSRIAEDEANAKGDDDISPGVKGEVGVQSLQGGAIPVIFTRRVTLWSPSAAQSAGPAGPEKAILAPMPDSHKIARRRSPQARSRLTPAPPRIDWCDPLDHQPRRRAPNHPDWKA